VFEDDRPRRWYHEDSSIIPSPDELDELWSPPRRVAEVIRGVLTWLLLVGANVLVWLLIALFVVAVVKGDIR
jgi:hypothetical protein